MIKVTLDSLINSKESITALIKKDMNAITSFSIMNMLDDIAEHIKNFEKVYNERVSHVREEEKDNEGKPIPGKYKFIDGKQEVFQEEINELLKAEIDLPHDPIDIAKLERVDISPAHLLFLKWMIKK